MSSTRVISNADKPLKGVLKQMLKSADEFRVASAFLNSGGLEVVREDIERILENEGSVTVLHGADFRITDPRAVRTLIDLRDRFGTFYYYVHYGWRLTKSHRFHPKLYIATADYKTYDVVIGSSNLTKSGLTSNEEVNAVMEGQEDGAPISECLRIFDSLVGSDAAVQPPPDFADRYEELYAKAGELPISAEPPPEFERLVEDLRAIARAAIIELPWDPTGPIEIVILAMQILESETEATAHVRSFRPLQEVYPAVERVTANAGIEVRNDIYYHRPRFHTNVRSLIWNNLANPKDGPPRGRSAFELNHELRGHYRLTDAYLQYAGE